MRIRALVMLVAGAVLATGGTAVPAYAEAPIEGAGAPGAIPGRYIVTEADGSTTTATGMRPDQARRLAASRRVRYVEQDRVLSMAQNDPPWGLDRIDQRPVTPSHEFTPTDDGSGVHAYVLDSGIRITHSEFGGRASYGWDYIANRKTATDCDGHGTHVAGTIGGAHYGVAKKVRLVSVRVLNCAGEGTLSSVINGVNWVTRNAVHPAVANMSIGGGKSPSLAAAVQRSINSGVTYVVAAGNENINAGNTSPAGLPAAITVGATDKSDRRAAFSNYGSVLDLFAPGVDVVSAWWKSDSATAIASGTSMASPHVAGAAALVLDAYPAMTPAQVHDYLVARSTKGKVTGLKGSPNRLLFVPPPPAAPIIDTDAITVTAGQAYAGKLALVAGRRGTWSVASGRLPHGLSLTSNGSISGTPVGAGESTIEVRFVDYVPHTVTKTIKVTVLGDSA
ncbi:S8 family peptidase [Actinoplanes sp. TBRC 11911]|uniref:S8 family peptidase n=1 Tax=Actinoplanes sp. TBRC 11911 TaxID=2729386 RepID=UPI00145F7F08|nr:S8 family peptidase [Actinoplanes sp. TBRC 11911]NMO51112.1 S8 family peptidase [Actinoplanes sp. TBRC 11911]